MAKRIIIPTSKTRVLLYSGGLDSFILSCVEPWDHAVFIRTGVPDNTAELHRLYSHIPEQRVTELDFSFLNKFELTNKIIPFRNYFFVLAAAEYGQIIMMSSTAGDTTKDKDSKFAKYMSTALTHFSTGPQEKVPPSYCGKGVSVILPFLSLSKTQIVRKYLNAGLPAEHLLSRSISCYYPMLSNGIFEPCWACRSCIRKYVALYINDVPMGKDIHDKITITILQDFYVDSIRKRRKKIELKDIQYALLKKKMMEAR